tara:strand:- start:667 stop:1338 length:672 start_codon:yes stop_codon:yes gene_type:complete
MTQNIANILEELAVNPGEENITEAPEPGAVSEINGTFPGSRIESAGYVYIWDTQTAKSSVCNRNMLASTLGKLRKDGTRFFTTVKPDFEPRGGSHKCLLHEDDENRAEYDELGLAVCTKDNLDSPYQVTVHMKARHPQESATIEDIHATAQREEDREFQRVLIQAAARGAALPTRDAPVKKDREPVVVQCEECATEFDGYNKMIATNRLKAHTKKEHGDTDGK